MLKGQEKITFIQQKKYLRKIFEDSGKVKLVIFGHTHYYHLEKINNITYLNVPSFTQNDATWNPCGSYVEVVMQPSIIDIYMKGVIPFNAKPYISIEL